MASTGEVWKLGHRPALDGLRGIAVLLVVVGHAFPAQFGGGGPVGVTIFFTLSGFLITTLLLEERHRTGGIALSAFYARRARRLLPALFVFLAVMVLLSALVNPRFAEPKVALMAVFYVANLYDGDWNGVSHTWSLSVEEQFYLVWPVLLLMLARGGRRPLAVVASIGLAVSVGFRLVSWNPHSTHTNAAFLLAGSLLAIAFTTVPVSRPSSRLLLPVSVAALVGMSCFGGEANAASMSTLASGIFSVAVLWVLASRRSAPSWITARPLTLIGRRSYGLYLWHFPIVAVVAYDGGVAQRLLAIGASWMVTLVSWHLVERRFLVTKEPATPPLAAPRTAGPVQVSQATG